MFENATYPITVAEFKTWFSRDFPYSSDPNVGITDNDITKAFSEASLIFNPTFWDTEDNKKLGFLYLTAHYLVIDLQNSSQGINGRYEGIMSNKSVGSVSVGYQLPSWVTDSPVYSLLAQTRYGMKYLSMILALMIGSVVVVKGATHA